jgi:hypothetical protein
MTYPEGYTTAPVNAMQLCRFWSAHVDALERHLLANTWALTAVAVVVIAYPIARIVVPVILSEMMAYGIVPDVVRTMLRLI